MDSPTKSTKTIFYALKFLVLKIKKFPNTKAVFLIIVLGIIASGITLYITNHKQKLCNSEKHYQPKQPAMTDSLSFLSMNFEKNQGQFAKEILFLSRDRGYTLYLSDNSAQLALKSNDTSGQNRTTCSHKNLNIRFLGANSKAIVTGIDKTPCKSNYFIGNDPIKWHTNVANFKKVKYENIYRGIDLVFYGNHGALEYDFIVSPGIDPNLIEIKIENADNIQIDATGNLEIEFCDEIIEFKAPLIYQTCNDLYERVNGRFYIKSNNVIKFKLENYNPQFALVIDPVLSYATYLGGAQEERIGAIAVDKDKNVFVVGTTASTDFPQTNMATGEGGSNDILVLKISGDGQSLEYSSVIGGRSVEYGIDIDIDTEGNAYICGTSGSYDDDDTPDIDESFPILNGFQTSLAGNYGQDVVIAKVGKTGNLLYSSYLGANNDQDQARAIAVDLSGNMYVTGTHVASMDKPDFPIRNAFQPNVGSYGIDGFVTKVNPNLKGDNSLIYSTFLGGANEDDPKDIAVDREGNALVVGRTEAVDFPLVNALFSSKKGDWDIFVTKLDASGSSAVFSTYIGGDKNDNALRAKFDKEGYSYIAGAGSEDFPTTPGVLDETGIQGYGGSIIFKMNPTGTNLEYSTFFSGARTILVNEDKTVYYLTAQGNRDSEGNWVETFSVEKLNEAGSGILSSEEITGLDLTNTGYYSSYALDNSGNAYFAKSPTRTDLPTINPIQAEHNGWSDLYIAWTGKSTTNLIFDQVMRGDLPIFTPLQSPATHQIIQQYRMMSAADTLFFSFEGRSSDGMAGLRLSNTRAVTPFPLKLNAKVIDPDSSDVAYFQLMNIHSDNYGIRFNVNKDGLYTIAVFLEEGSPGPFPASFQIHLSGNVGLPRKRINDKPEVERGTRLDILFNHPAPRPQILAGEDSLVAQTGLFKFANPVSITPYAIAVMLPPEPNGYPIGEAIIRAADPVILGQLQDDTIDRTSPTARTPEWTLPRMGSIFDFTQVPYPHSVEEWPPLPPLQGTIPSVIWESDGLGVELPLTTVNGRAQSIILDMGFGQEIVDGDGNDLQIFAQSGTYSVAVGNTPYSTDFITLTDSTSGNQEFDLTPSGLTSARFVRIMANPVVTVDAVKSLNVFADAIHGDIGAATDMAEATILMRRMKGPETNLDPFLELIAPDGSRLGENESGFGDGTSLDLSDAALIGIDLTQIGFHRFLGRGYHQIPDEQAFGSFFTRLESGGAYDTEKINISNRNEVETTAQKTGQINSTQQRDSYLFEAEPGQNMNIVVNALDTLLDPVIELFDPEDFLIASNDNFVNRDKNAAISLNLPDSSFSSMDILPNPSTYRIVVMANHGFSTFTRDEENNVNVFEKENLSGKYELKVFRGSLTAPATLPPSITAVSPQRVKAGTNNIEITILGENFQNNAKVVISGSGIQVNNIQFLSSKQLSCSIDVNQTAPLGWRDVTVINADGQEKTERAMIKILDTVGNVKLFWDPPNSSETLAPPENLTAFIDDELVSSYLPNQYNNSVTATHTPISEVEPNNSLEQAMVLFGELALISGSVQASDSGTIKPSNDDIEDLFRITISEPGVSLALDSFTSDCDLYVLDQYGSSMFESKNRGTTTSEQLAIQGLPNGTYYIGVSIYDPNPIGENSTPYMLTAMGKFTGGGETSTIQKYNIYRSTTPGAKTTGSLIASVDASERQYLDSAPFNALFYYQVTALYESGESTGSNESSLMVTNVDDNTLEQVSSFELFQNYPNPFNPVTHIAYNVVKSTHVRITIYNQLGRHIKTLVNSRHSAGHYSVSWNAKDKYDLPIAAGLYFCKMEADDFIKMIKLALVK